VEHTEPLGAAALTGAVLRSRSQVASGWLGGAFFGAVGLIAGLAGEVPTGIVAGVCGLVMVYVLALRTGLWVRPDGIFVRNPISSYEVPWAQIKGFRIGRRGVFGASCIVDLADGSTRYAFGLQVSTWSLGKPDAPERQLVSHLNDVLASRAR
jgi:hypothetical protein